jgi:hypothetical protein
MRSADSGHAPAGDAIRVILMEAARGEAKETRVNERTLMRVIESHRPMLIETFDSPSAFLHRSYFAKD